MDNTKLHYRDSKYSVIKYNIAGVYLYAVEDSNGYIAQYCDTPERARELCIENNNANQT